MPKKLLVKFDTSDRAQLVSAGSMTTKKRTKASRSRKSPRGKPRVIHGRVALRVTGYSGIQHVPASALIPYLPVTKLRAAAKRALGKTRKGRKKTKRRTRKARRRKTK